MNPSRTLKYRLLSSYLLVVAVTLSITAYFLDRTLEAHALRNLRSSLDAQARLIAAQLDTAQLLKNDAARLDPLVKRLGAGAGARITVIAASGRVLADTGIPYPEIRGMENHLGRAEVAGAAGGGTGSAVRRSETLKMDMLYLAVPAGDPMRPAGYVRLAMPLSGVDGMLSSLRRTIFFSFALSAVFALATGWLVIWLAAGPFGEIVEGSRRFAAGDFAHRIPARSSGELGRLAETLNSMAEEISRRMREAELRRLELEAAFRGMPEAILVADGKGVITRLNPRAEKLMDARGFSAVGMRLSEMPAGPGLADAALKALSTGQEVSLELAPPSAPGLTLSVNASPIIENGTVGGCVLTARDVTEARRLETMRRDFVANVSHELKTPLTAIKGCAETLLHGALGDKTEGPGFVRSIYDQAARLGELVGDLLNIARAEAGGAPLAKTVFPLRALADEAAAVLGPQMAERRIAFANTVPAGLQVTADREKLGQALSNLLDNAVKYNREGGAVTVSAEDLANRLRVAVADTGQGIPPGHLPRVFERFYRVDKARSRELGGTGLGLSIAKHVVESHGGTIGADSVPGAGSTFWFILPK